MGLERGGMETTERKTDREKEKDGLLLFALKNKRGKVACAALIA
jgi:hypothetical protein